MIYAPRQLGQLWAAGRGPARRGGHRRRGRPYTHVYVDMCTYICIHIYIYIYIYRERERERDIHICMRICISASEATGAPPGAPTGAPTACSFSDCHRYMLARATICPYCILLHCE